MLDYFVYGVGATFLGLAALWFLLIVGDCLLFTLGHTIYRLRFGVKWNEWWVETPLRRKYKTLVFVFVKEPFKEAWERLFEHGKTTGCNSNSGRWEPYFKYTRKNE